MTAVLACRADTLLGHRAAMALWGLRPVPSGPIDVVTPRKLRGQKGIRVHYARALHPDDRAEIDGIPVTSLARTLIDWAEDAPPHQLRRVLEEIHRRETLLDGRKLEAALHRAHHRKGVRRIREALAEINGTPPWTQSELENSFLALVREHSLPEPQANVMVLGETVDFFWPEARLIVEVDSYPWHKTTRKFEDDRRKDTKFQLGDLRVIRPTQDRLEGDRAALARDLRQLLGLSGGNAAAA